MTSPHSNSNPSSAFDLLAEPVRRWIWDQGWAELRDIQERAILGLLKADQDLIIAAPTAGGKTEAAFLPLISSVLTTPGAGGFDLVYVAPLRALINDQTRRMEDLCERAELPVYPWHGDISQDVKARARRNPRGVLLITPESLEAAVRAAGSGNPNPVREYAHNHHRRTPCLPRQRARYSRTVPPGAVGTGRPTPHPESGVVGDPSLRWTR